MIFAMKTNLMKKQYISNSTFYISVQKNAIANNKRPVINMSDQVEIDEDTLNQVKEQLQLLKEPVSVKYFTDDKCAMCKPTQQLLTMITDLSDKLTLEVFKADADGAEIEKYKIDKYPATVIEGKGKGLVRFFGIPSGYEFGTLLAVIIEQSTGQSQLKDKTIDRVNDIDKPVHIQVFVTPTCPYCPMAVITAQRFAMLNKNIIGDMIEATEFQEYSAKYRVMGVPKIVINETTTQEGAIPEGAYIRLVRKAIS
jgi:glutaredoxin-like protein